MVQDENKNLGFTKVVGNQYKGITELLILNESCTLVDAYYIEVKKWPLALCLLLAHD